MGAAVGGTRRRTSLVNLVDHVANGLVIESRPTAVGENFQVVCTSLKTTDDYEEGVKFHSAIAAVKMAAAAQWRRRRRNGGGGGAMATSVKPAAAAAAEVEKSRN